MIADTPMTMTGVQAQIMPPTLDLSHLQPLVPGVSAGDGGGGVVANVNASNVNASMSKGVGGFTVGEGLLVGALATVGILIWKKHGGRRK